MVIDLDGIYAAVEDDRAFDGLAGQVAAACNTRSAIFVNLMKDGRPSLVQTNYWPDALMLEYRQHFIHADPWTETAIAIGRFGRAAALDAAMAPEDFAQTAIYNDLVRVHGDDTGRCLGVMPALGREGLMMAIHRAATDTAFTVREEQRLNEVYCHVRRVVSVRKTLASERDRSATLQDIVNRTSEPLLRVDRGLRVTAISAAAERLLDEQDGLALRGQRLLSSPKLTAALKAAVAAIIDRTSDTRTALLCPRPSGRPPYRLVVLPAGFEGGAGALLRVDDPDRDRAKTGWRRALGDAYRLSAMEIDLAARLYADQSLDDIAEQRGVTRETLRTQLKSLFYKTGVNRQSLLIKLLATFPA